MKLTTLTSADFRRIAKLLARKDDLRARIVQIDQQLAAYESACGEATLKSAANLPRRSKRKPRGPVKQAILALLKRAGHKGITVKEIAGQLDTSTNRVYTWFYRTGSSVTQIKKVGSAQYRWED